MNPLIPTQTKSNSTSSDWIETIEVGLKRRYAIKEYFEGAHDQDNMNLLEKIAADHPHASLGEVVKYLTRRCMATGWSTG